MNIWLWLYKLSIKKIKKQHLSDFKCPNCNLKISNSRLQNPPFYSMDNDEILETICGQCMRTSYWKTEDPICIRCNKDGSPLKYVKKEY